MVTVSSIGGRQPSPVTGVPYAASKAAVLGLTRRLAREVGPRGIRVNAIAPGLFLTGRLQQMYDEMPAAERDEVLGAIPLSRFPELREIVDPTLFLASDEASYITGVVLDVNGGRFMPLSDRVAISVEWNVSQVVAGPRTGNKRRVEHFSIARGQAGASPRRIAATSSGQACAPWPAGLDCTHTRRPRAAGVSPRHTSKS